MPKILKKEPSIENSENNIGKKIAQIRKARGLTQKDLSSKIKISRDLLASYELNRIRIYGDMIIEIAKALEVSTDEILNTKTKNETDVQDFYKLDVRWIKKINEIKQLSQEDQRKVNIYIKDLLKKN